MKATDWVGIAATLTWVVLVLIGLQWMGLVGCSG